MVALMQLYFQIELATREVKVYFSRGYILYSMK
jgi:hypothetical protein